MRKIPVGQVQSTLNRLYAEQLILFQNMVRDVAFLILEALVVGNQFGNPTGTPVKTGFARGSWHVVLGPATEAQEPGQLDPSGGSTLASEGTKVAESSLGVPITFANGAEYFVHLEYGSSKQAPEGVVRLVLAHFPELVQHVVAKYQAAGFNLRVA